MNRTIKIIYTAGPYRSKSFFRKLRNIWRARKVAQKLWKEGFAAICPHTNSMLFSEKNNEFILDAYIEIMLGCDAVLVLKNYRRSKGTRSEIKVAKQYGIPVFYTIESLLNVMKRESR